MDEVCSSGALHGRWEQSHVLLFHPSTTNWSQRGHCSAMTSPPISSKCFGFEVLSHQILNKCLFALHADPTDSVFIPGQTFLYYISHFSIHFIFFIHFFIIIIFILHITMAIQTATLTFGFVVLKLFVWLPFEDHVVKRCSCCCQQWLIKTK